MVDTAFESVVTDELPEGKEVLVLGLTFEAGQEVTIRVEYPNEKAILALSALARVAEQGYLNDLLYNLRHEPSVVESLKASGLSYADEDDFEDFDDDDDDDDDEDWGSEVPD